MNRPGLSPADTDAAYAAARCVVLTHQRLVNFVRAGQTLAQIDAEVARIFRDLRCKSCFLGYRLPRLPAFPSHACLSLNECIVHGTAGYVTRPLVEGDLLKIDIGVTYNGWIGDAAWTYAVKSASPTMKKLMACGRDALAKAVASLGPTSPLLDHATAVQSCVERTHGFFCVRGLGGHGIGRKLHGPPFVANTVPTHPGEWPEALLKPSVGTLVAIEPMIAVGTGNTKQGRGEWPIFTADGSLAVHYEADVLITPDGRRDLTEGMQELPDVVG